MSKNIKKNFFLLYHYFYLKLNFSIIKKSNNKLERSFRMCPFRVDPFQHYVR